MCGIRRGAGRRRALVPPSGSRGGFSGVFRPSRGDVVALDIYPGFFLPAGPAPLVGVRVGSPASQGRGPLPAAVAVAAVTEGHGQDRAPRQERLRSRAGLPGMARAVAQRGRPAPRPGSARFEGEGARLGEPTLPAAPCAKVDFCSHLASAEGASPRGPV